MTPSFLASAVVNPFTDLSLELTVAPSVQGTGAG